MHTTEEAKLLWCPMVRISVMPSHGGPSGINDPGTEFHGNCIADGCAAWRWDGRTVVPERRQTDTFWPEEDEPKAEPARVVKLRGVEQDVPDSAVWVPLAGEGDNIEGGYWVEPQAQVDAEYEAELAKVRATMRGYCGLAGSVVR